MRGPTPPQTVGPFFHDALIDGETAGFTNRLVPENTPGAIVIQGTVFDGAGEPVPDAMVEILHADPDGKPTCFGRSDTRDGGRFFFLTVRPGAAAGEAPHVKVSVFARGLLKRLVSRIYFPDRENGGDPVLALVPKELVGTLISAQEGDNRYRSDIHLQGDRQTVFFDV